MIIVVMVVALISCSKNDDKPNDNNPMSAYTYSTTYTFKVDEEVVGKGNCNSISVYPGVEINNALILFKGAVFTFDETSNNSIASITGIPYKIGEEATIGSNNDIGLALFRIGEAKKMFMASSGVITRVANNKIMFNGEGRYSSNKEKIITFSGTITSEAIALIKKSK